MAVSKVPPRILEWTRPVPREQWDASNPALLNAAKPYEEIEQKIGYTFQDKGFLLAAFTHCSLPANARLVPCILQPMDHLGDALLKFLLSAKLYGCLHPLSPRSLHDARKHVDSNYSFGLAAVRNGFHRFLRSGSPALSEAVVGYVRGLENAVGDAEDAFSGRSHVKVKHLPSGEPFEVWELLKRLG
ncbi:hypothetical protein V5799_030046 [Amblyomma americanum]|uniref:RNase III domain-containing protein n=1 Tax=Amblyomma americanum TaxID=6943 RepID=A0AAQ4EPB0_AMBAM